MTSARLAHRAGLRGGLRASIKHHSSRIQKRHVTTEQATRKAGSMRRAGTRAVSPLLEVTRMREALAILRWVLILGVAVMACAMAQPQPAAAQAGFDRPGSDYRTFALKSGDPAECASTCESDRKCRSWSFSYPAGKPGGAACKLKNAVPNRTESTCCISGVRGAGIIERRTRSMEVSIDRIGGDLRDFDLEPGQGDDDCRKACDADGSCRAWTFAHAGYFGKAPRCYLKKEIKPPSRRPCCISGVVR